MSAVSADVRLAIGAAAAWLSLAICADLSPAAIVAVAVGAAMVGCAGVLFRVGWLRPIAAAGFCVTLVLVPFAGRVWIARASPLTKLALGNTAVTLELVTTGDPRTLAAHGVAGVAAGRGSRGRGASG